MIDSFPLDVELKNLFWDQMGQQTSGYLYGSAATGNWVPSRSDLDLLLFVPAEKLEQLGEQIRLWREHHGRTILDGFALFPLNSVLMAKRFEEFHLPACPAIGDIQLIDWWNIKNRSRHLFGSDLVKGFPDVSLEQLSCWARRELIKSGLSQGQDIPKIDVVLSKLIWAVSWSARLLMLSRGLICDSKRDALKWLAQEYPETNEPVGLLLDDYFKSDEDPVSITPNQSLQIRRFCSELILRELSS